jgi:hypothetical protein
MHNNISDKNNNKKDDGCDSASESVIKIKKSDYKNIVDQVIEYQYTIDVLSKLKPHINNTKGGEVKQTIKSENNITEQKNKEDEKSISLTSIFKKRSECIQQHQLTKKESEHTTKSPQNGGKKEIPFLTEQTLNEHASFKDDKKNTIKESLVNKSEESEEATTKSNNESSNDNSTSGSESDSKSYRTEEDIYRTTNTEGGINKAYNKLNKEMEYINKNAKGGKMNNKEIVNRINFLLGGFRILDRIKQNGKKRK